jgi:hypothetical protein
MADFSLTTLLVVPVGQTALPSSGSTQDLTAGQVGFFKSDYTLATPGNVASKPHFYLAQGRENTYLQGSKRSDKISSAGTNVTEVYKVTGCAVAANQVTDLAGFNVTCGEDVTITLRGHSSYLDTLYFNGFTRSVTVKSPCCDCGGDPCTTVDVPALIDLLIAKLMETVPGENPQNISLNTYYQFQRLGNDADAVLRVSGKPVTKYGQPCDVSADPHEYDRMWFRAFIYAGPATTADFIVEDACDIIATSTVIQRSSYPTGISSEIAQLEIDFHSYQAGYLKHLYRTNGFNQNFETYVDEASVYDTYYIKFNDIDKSAGNWGDFVPTDSMVIVAVPQANTALIAEIDAILAVPFSSYEDFAACITTTSTTTSVWPSTTTTSTLIP